METQVISIEPKLSTIQFEDLLLFCKKLAKDLKKKTTELREGILDKERKGINRLIKGKQFHAKTDLYFVKSVIVDLLRQDWDLVIKGGKIKLKMNLPDPLNVDIELEKTKTRRRHLLARNEQLQEPSVLEFISDIERKKLTEKGWFSIFSVMRDGNLLARELDEIRSIVAEDAKISALNNVIKPYIQFVEPAERCQETGMLLSDIWRYFRHTWISEYKTLPGRTMSILIRDSAAPNHPVIGIAALGNSVAQQTIRDEWIGWEGEAFIKKMVGEPSAKYGKWIVETLNSLLEDIYLKDFFAGKIISLSNIRHPTAEIIKNLRLLSGQYRQEHIKRPDKAKFSVGNENLQWDQRAESNLFKSKRAVMLAELLSIKLILNKYGFVHGSKKELEACLDKSDFRSAVEKLARKAKSIHVGIDMMDIIICGAIAPYNHILGGKLVCMLLTSPEVVRYYNERYASSVSLIASSMKGKAVIRKPQLVLLATTSLYGFGSSQYNRVKIPCEEIGGDKGKKVEYKELGISEGFGSFHFSKKTIELADTVAGRETGAKRVNSIFGEGSNPLLRKLKDALEFLELESNPILKHSNKRVVYGVALAENFGEVLMGLAHRPKYCFSQNAARQKTELIAKFWTRRWLLNRIMNDNVLEQIEAHTLSYPITHGARVPIIDDENQMSLFM